MLQYMFLLTLSKCITKWTNLLVEEQVLPRKNARKVW